MWHRAKRGAGSAPSPPSPGVPGERPGAPAELLAPPRHREFSPALGDGSGRACPVGDRAKCRGPTRAAYRHDLVPHPGLSSPLSPPCPGTGTDPVPPFSRGWRRWPGAKVRLGVLGTRLMPGGKDASLPPAQPCPRLPVWAPQSWCLFPSPGWVTPSVPRSSCCCREGWRVLGWPGDSRQRSPFCAWGSLSVSLGCHESRRRQAQSTDAGESIPTSAAGGGESSASNACGRAAQPARLPH